MRGWVDPSGAWRLEAEVHHGRFRCATYETGIQLGRGRSGCIGVEWLTDLDFGSRLRHCNHASRLHVGRGAFPETTGDLRDASCVRVVVRCEGNC